MLPTVSEAICQKGKNRRQRWGATLRSPAQRINEIGTSCERVGVLAVTTEVRTPHPGSSSNYSRSMSAWSPTLSSTPRCSGRCADVRSRSAHQNHGAAQRSSGRCCSISPRYNQCLRQCSTALAALMISSPRYRTRCPTCTALPLPLNPVLARCAQCGSRLPTHWYTRVPG